MPARIKILAVSQDPALVRFLRHELNADDYQVASARPADECLRETLEAERPDCIVVDIVMPSCDGIGTSLRLRQWTERPIMMLSTYGASQGRVRGLNLGSDTYLSEPFGADVLAWRIAATLNRADGVGV